MPDFTFCEGRKQAMTKFILFVNWDMADRNSALEEFTCIWQSKRVGIISIETEKNMNSLFHATFSWPSAVVVSFKNSLWMYLRKTWPMQAWIPVVISWSLYFWKSVFSFRADSILKSEGDFIPGLPSARSARGTEPHTHGMWSISFRLVVTWLTERTYVRVYRLYGWGRGDYQKEGRGVSGVSWQVHIFNIGF